MRVGICTLGCKVNIYESEYIISLLKDNGYEIVDFNDLADIYIINTCTVTNASDNKSRKMIHQARKNNCSAVVVVMGCYSQIKEVEADIVIGNKDKSKIVELIDEYLVIHERIYRNYDLSDVPFEDMEISSFNQHTRAFVKIQDGCDAFCSYCIIPYARGGIRSKQKEKVISEITNLVKSGYKEIVLTGIHTGKYGRDIGSSLTELLGEIIKIPNLYRVRISSIEINEITDEIIEMIKNSNVIAHHLHIPLQSGSDKILKLMNRKYDLNYFINRINQIRGKVSDISITTDLIVGFPNEDENDFRDTISTLEKLKFSKIHVFPYSKRDGTIAAKMINQVDPVIKKQRVKEVLLISEKNENEFFNKFVGKVMPVITEKHHDGIYGYTSNYLLVKVGDNALENQILNVVVEK